MPRTIHQLFDLTGKTALITGGSHGPGLHMAHALGEAGARLMLCARHADALEAACADLQAAGLDARWVAADCAVEADLEKLVCETLQRMGDVDILVNNASASWGDAAPEDAVTAWDEVMNRNLRGTFVLCQLVARQSMIGRGGRIINVAAGAGLGGPLPDQGGLANYTAKGALVSLTRALAREWAPHGINVNALCPGLPVGHDDLKGAVLLLASDAGQPITGQCLVVDGGVSACLEAVA